MLLIYNAENILNIGLSPKNASKNKPLHAEIISILPGLNFMEEKKFKQCSDHFKIEHLIEEDILEIAHPTEGDKKKAKESRTAFELEGLTESHSVKLIKKCLSKPLLESIEEQDSRPKIIKAVQGQLKSLELTEDERKAQG